MSPGRTVATLVAVTMMTLVAAHAQESPVAPAGDGVAVVRVVTNPDFGSGTFDFRGTPAGELDLGIEERRRLVSAGLAPGAYTSTVVTVDPEIVGAGYRLAEIRCDDRTSAERSTGTIESGRATFRIEEGEMVTCTFVFSAGGECLCPKEGRWRGTNHPGSMVCSGAMSMTMPLLASSSTGTMRISDDCATIIAEGMSEDEATIEMHLMDDCSYEGSVGGERDGIPMVIHFTWEVVDEETITGELHSTVSQQGMTCEMNRDYDLAYIGN